MGLVLVWIFCISFLSLGLLERKSDTCSECVSPKCQTLIYWCPCSLVFCQNMTAGKQRWWCSPVWEVIFFQHSFSNYFTNLLWITCSWKVLWHTKRLQAIFVQFCSVQCNYLFFTVRNRYQVTNKQLGYTLTWSNLPSPKEMHCRLLLVGQASSMGNGQVFLEEGWCLMFPISNYLFVSCLFHGFQIALFFLCLWMSNNCYFMINLLLCL